MTPEPQRKVAKLKDGSRVPVVQVGGKWYRDPDGIDVPGNLGTTDGAGPKVSKVVSGGAEPPAPIPANGDQAAAAMTGGGTPEIDAAERSNAEDLKNAQNIEIPGDPPSKGEAVGRGFGKGLSFGGGDEMAGVGAKVAEAFPQLAAFMGLPGATPYERKGRASTAPLTGKTSFDGARDTYAAEDDAAQLEHPYLFGGAQLVGGAAATMPLAAFAGPGAFGVKGLQLASKLGGGVAGGGLAGILEGGAIGGAQGALSANPGERGTGALEGASVGGVLGGAAPSLLAFPGVEAGLQSVKGGLRRIAGVERAAASGMTAADMTKMRESTSMVVDPEAPGGMRPARGDDAIVQHGERIEDMKLHKGSAGPASQRTYRDNSEGLRDKAITKINTLSDQLEGEGLTAQEPNPTGGFKPPSKAPAGQIVKDYSQVDPVGPRPKRAAARGATVTPAPNEAAIGADAESLSGRTVTPPPKKGALPNLGSPDSDWWAPAAEPPPAAPVVPKEPGEAIASGKNPERYSRQRNATDGPPKDDSAREPDFSAPEGPDVTGEGTSKRAPAAAAKPRMRGAEYRSMLKDTEVAPAPRKGVSVDLGKVADALQEDEHALSKLPLPEAMRDGEDLAKRIALMRDANGGAGFVSYKTALKMRVYLDHKAFNARGALNGEAADLYRKMAGHLQKAMMSAAEQESPEIAEALRQANLEYHVSSTVADDAGRAVDAQHGHKGGAGGMHHDQGLWQRALKPVTSRAESAISRTAREGQRTLAAFPDFLPPAAASSEEELRNR